MRRTTMNLSQFQRRTSLALCFLALAGIAYGQAQQGAQFEPQVGQAGKDVVWVPTPQELVNKMLDLAKVTPQDYLIDLGSGDGRTVITAAKRGVRALGIEYNHDGRLEGRRNELRDRKLSKLVHCSALDCAGKN